MLSDRAQNHGFMGSIINNTTMFWLEDKVQRRPSIDGFIIIIFYSIITLYNCKL